ncbi:MAG: beta-glucanase, partial [Adhaeribacter sp.]|nr:beta-glucanase [Adhaeribacter sp.]
GYNAARTAVAVSDSPTGPYTYLQSHRPNAGIWPVNFNEAWQKKTITEKDLKAWSDEWKKEVAEGLFIRRDFEKGQMSRDMTVYVDDNGKAYHIHAAEENLTLHISELTDDYIGFTGKWMVVAPAGHNEAPAICKYKGKYYLITSGCTGWDPNAARSFVATSMWGPWEALGNPAVGQGADLTFESQGTFILPVAGKKDAFIFMADRWRPNNPIDGRYVWLPLVFENGKPILRWHDEWKLNTFAAARQ